MGSSRPGAARGDDRFARFLQPRIVLSVLALVMVVAVFLTPEGSNDLDLRLTTYSTGPAGAKGLYEVMGRLGWPTERRLVQFTRPLDSTAVYAVFGGAEPLTSTETHVLLDAVRHGAGLIYVVERGDLTDSLPLRHSAAGGALAPAGASDTIGCKPQSIPSTLAWLANGIHLYSLVDSAPTTTHEHLPRDTSVFLSVTMSKDEPLLPAVVGYPMEKGRVVAVSDPDALRNDVVRVCQSGVGPRLVQAIRYASHGRRPPLVFDEFHQGFGEHASPWSTTMAFLGRHPVGRAILQLVGGALILLLAVGARALAPQRMAAIERRSPLEHVDALALAYERIDATRTAAARLVRGLRRRHDRGGWSLRAASQAGTGDADDRFLTAVAASHPRLTPDVNRLRVAEHESIEPGELLAVAESIDRIDAAFGNNKDHPFPSNSH